LRTASASPVRHQSCSLGPGQLPCRTRRHESASWHSGALSWCFGVTAWAFRRGAQAIRPILKVCRAVLPGTWGLAPITTLGRTLSPSGEPRSGSGALFDPGGELLHLVVGATAFGHLFADLAIRVHHRGVIATAENLADSG
jgi:hypothetical protein